jgi:hypothetical protein
MALSDKDVDATMASDWAAIREKYEPEEIDAPDDGAPANDAAGAADDNGEPTKNAKGETIPVSREADGKFKAADKDAKGKPVVEDKGQAKPKITARQDFDKQQPTGPAAPETQQPVGDQPQVRDINRAPSTWKPAARAEWEKLSPAIRAEIHRREADFQNGQAQLLPDAQLGKGMREVIRPYEMMIQAEGGTPERAVADLFRTAAIFRVGTVEQKYQAVGQICRQFGVDLAAIGRAALQQQQGGQPQPNGQQPQGQPQAFRDPRVDQMLAHQRQQEQQRVQQETSQTENTVTRWMNEMDAEGNPKRPYLSDVINEMSALVPQIRQADPTLTHAQALDAAYDRAIWAHPEIRTLLAQKQQADLDAKRRSDNQGRVRDARRAGSVNVPRRGAAPSPGKPGTMDETIANTARDLGLIT